MTTLADYKAELKHFTQNNQIPDSTMTFCINGALLQVSDDLRCIKKLDTIITALGTVTYSLNSDCLLAGAEAAYVVVDRRSRVLARVSERERDDFGADANNASDGTAPKVFSLYGRYIRFGPDPVKTCTVFVDYSAAHAYVSAAGDSVRVPIQYSTLVMKYAKYLWYCVIGDSQQAYEKQEYEAELQRKLALIRQVVDVQKEQ